MYKSHSNAEDEVVFPALDLKVKNIAHAYELEHEAEEKLFEQLVQQVHSALGERIGGAGRSALMQQLACTTSAVQASLKQHLAKEEEQVFPLIIKHFSREEQARLVWQVMSSIPLSIYRLALLWMGQVLSPRELQLLQRHMQHSVPFLELRDTFRAWMASQGSQGAARPLAPGATNQRWSYDSHSDGAVLLSAGGRDAGPGGAVARGTRDRHDSAAAEPMEDDHYHDSPTPQDVGRTGNDEDDDAAATTGQPGREPQALVADTDAVAGVLRPLSPIPPFMAEAANMDLLGRSHLHGLDSPSASSSSSSGGCGAVSSASTPLPGTACFMPVDDGDSVTMAVPGGAARGFVTVTSNSSVASNPVPVSGDAPPGEGDEGKRGCVPGLPPAGMISPPRAPANNNAGVPPDVNTGAGMPDANDNTGAVTPARPTPTAGDRGAVPPTGLEGSRVAQAVGEPSPISEIVHMHDAIRKELRSFEREARVLESLRRHKLLASTTKASVKNLGAAADMDAVGGGSLDGGSRGGVGAGSWGGGPGTGGVEAGSVGGRFLARSQSNKVIAGSGEDGQAEAGVGEADGGDGDCDDLALTRAALGSRVRALSERHRYVFAVCSFHSAAEDEVMHPAVDRKVKGMAHQLAHDYRREHGKQRRSFLRLQRLLEDASREASKEGVEPASLLELRDLCRQVVHTVQCVAKHMSEEEAKVLPLIEQHFPLEEQRQLVWRSLLAMPFRILERVLPGMAAEVTEAQAYAMVRNMQLAANSIDASLVPLFSSLLTRGGHKGRESRGMGQGKGVILPPMASGLEAGAKQGVRGVMGEKVGRDASWGGVDASGAVGRKLPALTSYGDTGMWEEPPVVTMPEVCGEGGGAEGRAFRGNPEGGAFVPAGVDGIAAPAASAVLAMGGHAHAQGHRRDDDDGSDVDEGGRVDGHAGVGGDGEHGRRAAKRARFLHKGASFLEGEEAGNGVDGLGEGRDYGEGLDLGPRVRRDSEDMLSDGYADAEAEECHREEGSEELAASARAAIGGYGKPSLGSKLARVPWGVGEGDGEMAMISEVEGNRGGKGGNQEEYPDQSWKPIDHIFQFHKAIRKELAAIDAISHKLGLGLSAEAAAAPGAAEQAEGLLRDFISRFQFLWGIYRAHSNAEDEIVFPALESKDALHNVSHSYTLDHRQEDELFEKIGALLQELEADSPGNFAAQIGAAPPPVFTGGSTTSSANPALLPPSNAPGAGPSLSAPSGALTTTGNAPATTTSGAGGSGRWRYETYSRPWRSVVVQLPRLWAAIRATLELHVASEEAELWPLFTAHFTIREQDALVGRIIGRTGAEILQAMLPFITKALTEQEQREMMEVMRSATKHTMFDQWLNATRACGGVGGGGGGEGDGAGKLFRPGWGHLFAMNQHELQAAIRRVSKDESLEPKRKAYIIQNLMTSRWIAARQKVHQLGDRLDLGPTEEERRPSYHDTGACILGCQHYQRGCKLKAECCGRFFPCRLCHDAATDHTMDRQATREMMCMRCHQVQPVGQHCMSATCQGRSMAAFYCSICKLLVDGDKSIYHCPFCNVCRVGKGLGIDSFHCMRCNSCMSLSQSEHNCHERGMESNCPLCHDYLFTSTAPVKSLPCGHLMHSACFQMYTRERYTCPICTKSLGDMTMYFGMLDALLDAEKLPEEYANRTQEILCNDCAKPSTCPFHFVYHKCCHCGSYNTKVT
eukprot:jgi/Mesvir1/19188/Mv11510-RA.1